MPLELDHLRNSATALAELLAVSENEARMAQFTEVERKGIRAGVIQNFEVTYELCWKLTARWLNANVTPGIATGVARGELFRLAAQHRLIADVDVWMAHHRARNDTAHLYNEEKAILVYQAAREFAHDAQWLFAALDARND